MRTSYDAIVIGSGPNGFAAAITLAQAGHSVAIFEANPVIGGGLRSAELTLPGFTHDLCSAVHPLGLSSPFFRTLPLRDYGLEWIQPDVPLAHPFDNGKAAVLYRSIEKTAAGLGCDNLSYQRLMRPFVDNWDKLEKNILGPLRFPQHPVWMMRFAFLGIQSASWLLDCKFKEQMARGLFAGLAAHSILPLNKLLTAAFGMVLGILGHRVGWPIAKGGSQSIANALAGYLRSLGGEIITGVNVTSFDQPPSSEVILCDISPKAFLEIAENQLPKEYCSKLRDYRYGPGVFKMDWALNHPIPWKNSDCKFAGTVHLGDSAEEIAASENMIWSGRVPEKPYVLLSQPSLFDPSRAPAGKHTAWAYCHVPNGSTIDMSEKIEAQIERFAPGFRDCVLERSCKNAMQMQQYNPNYVGGDINGGEQGIWQAFARPVSWLHPYSTPLRGVYLCSSCTPPGGGVHGMCGFHAASLGAKILEKRV